MFGTTYPAGTKIRLQVSSTAQSPTFTIDLADFEQVAGADRQAVRRDRRGRPTSAPTRPARTDSTAKFQAAVDAGKAQGRAVYIPQGTFTL